MLVKIKINFCIKFSWKSSRRNHELKENADKCQVVCHSWLQRFSCHGIAKKNLFRDLFKRFHSLFADLRVRLSFEIVNEDFNLIFPSSSLRDQLWDEVKKIAIHFRKLLNMPRGGLYDKMRKNQFKRFSDWKWQKILKKNISN